MDESNRVLHVEDDADFAALTADYLAREDANLTVTTESDVESGLERLAAADVDCVVSDFDLPATDGIAFLERVRERDARLPFILFTGKGSEEVASEALAKGATDYLQKETGADQFAVLANRVENAVERHRAVVELERQNDRYETAEEIADLGTWEYDVETGEAWLSDGAYRILGLPDAYQPSRATASEHIHPDERATVDDAVDRAIDAGEPFDVEVRYVGGAGPTQWVRIRGDPKVADGEVARLRATIQDVTGRKAHEHELERYETIVEAAGDPVYTLDEEGAFTFVNDALLSITGYDEDALLGNDVSVLMGEDDFEEGLATVQSLLEDDERRRGTFQMEAITADGRHIPSEVHVALLPDDDGFRGTVGVVRNVSERERRERALERKTEHLQEFVSIVSHDLRNPLNVAQSRVELARRDGTDAGHLDAASDALDRVAAIIEDTLTLARLGDDVDEAEPVDLAEVARGAWPGDAEGAELRVLEDVTVTGDPNRLYAVLEHLFENAVQHGEDVTVSVGATDGGFYVADDGPGVSPADRERVFEPGYAATDAGTGFGLAIVERIAAAHGWEISLDESEEGGARFEITEHRSSGP